MPSDNRLFEVINQNGPNPISSEDSDISHSVGMLMTKEGTKAHYDSRGILTSPGGMTFKNFNLEATKMGIEPWVRTDDEQSQFGFNASLEDTQRIMSSDIKRRRDVLVGAIRGFNQLEPSARWALMDVSYNANISNSSNSFPKLKKLLLKYNQTWEPRDLGLAMRQILDVVRIRNKDGSGNSKGLASRRAASFNNVARDVGFSPITRIKGNADGSISYYFKWLAFFDKCVGIIQST